MLIERKEYVDEETGTVGYIEAVFNSGNVLKTTYFPNNQRLYIAFNRGHTYSYGNISREMYDEFEASDSQGKYFHEKINNKLKFPTRKEFTLYPNEIKDLKNIVEEFNENNKMNNYNGEDDDDDE